MCKIREGINLLPPGITLNGVIIKTELGHVFLLNGNLLKLRENETARKNKQEAAGIDMVFEPVEEFKGEKEMLRARIKSLNKQANLPGVGAATKAA